MINWLKSIFKPEPIKEPTDSPELVLARVMKRKIDWYDFANLKPEEQKEYYVNAQAALRNKTLVNEINHLTADIVEHIVKRSRDFEEVDKLRHYINALSVIKERLESIPDPEEPEKPKDNLYNAI